MRWLSSFALLLYFGLLCTPQAFAVHDSRLSPLADKQFHAVTPIVQDCTANSEQDSSDEPLQTLPTSKTTDPKTVFTAPAVLVISCTTPAFRFAQQARAPPMLSHT